MVIDAGPRGRAGIFLVVESNPIVALDLAQSIREVCPRAVIRSVTTAEAALVVLAEGDALVAAFLSLREERILESGLDRAVLTAGGRVVVVSAILTAEAARRRDWLLLAAPFRIEDVHQMVAGLCPDPVAVPPPVE